MMQQCSTISRLRWKPFQFPSHTSNLKLEQTKEIYCLLCLLFLLVASDNKTRDKYSDYIDYISNPAAYCVVIVLAVVVKVFSVSCPEHETTMFTLPEEIRDRKWKCFKNGVTGNPLSQPHKGSESCSLAKRETMQAQIRSKIKTFTIQMRKLFGKNRKLCRTESTKLLIENTNHVSPAGKIYFYDLCCYYNGCDL